MKIEKDKALLKVKGIGSFIAGGSTFMLINGITRALLPPQVNAVVGLGVALGSNLLSGCISTHVCDYVVDTIDSIAQVAEDATKECKRLKEVINETPKTEELG